MRATSCISPATAPGCTRWPSKSSKRSSAGDRPFRRPGTALQPQAGPAGPDPFAEELAEHARIAESAGLLGPDVRRTYLRRATVRAAWTFQLDGTARCWRQLADLSSGAERGVALVYCGRARRMAGRMKETEPLLEEGAGLLEQAGDRAAEGVALEDLSSLLQLTGRNDRAIELLERALGLQRAGGNAKLVRQALTALAAVALNQGSSGRAESLLAEAMALCADRDDRASTLSTLGNLLRETGRVEAGEAALREALALHREAGRRRNEGIVLGNLAILLLETGRVAEAEQAFLGALAVHRETGNRRGEESRSGISANLCREAGRSREARALHAQALARHREVNELRFEGITLGNLPASTLPRSASPRPSADSAPPSTFIAPSETADSRHRPRRTRRPSCAPPVATGKASRSRAGARDPPVRREPAV